MRKLASPNDKMERKEVPLQRTQETNYPDNRIPAGILKLPQKSLSVNKASSNLGKSQNSSQSFKVKTDTTKRKADERSTLGNDSRIIKYTNDKSPSVLKPKTNNRTGSNICFSRPEESMRRVKIIRKQPQAVPREVIAGPSRFYSNAGEGKKQVEFADLDEVYGTPPEYSSSESDSSLPYSKECPYVYQSQHKTPNTLFQQSGSSNKVEQKLADSSKEGKKDIIYPQLSRVTSSRKPRSELIRGIGEKKDLSERQHTQLVEVATSIEGLLESSSQNKKDEITVDLEFVIDKSNSNQIEAFSSKNETIRTHDTGISPKISYTKTLPNHSTYSGQTKIVQNPISTNYASFLHDYIYNDDETSMKNLPNFSSTHQAVRERYSDFLPKSKNSVISQNLEKAMPTLDDTSRRSSFTMTKSINPLGNLPTSILNKVESSQIVQKSNKNERTLGEEIANNQAEAFSSKNETISAYEKGISSNISHTTTLPDHNTYSGHTNIVHSTILTKHASFLQDYNKDETSMSTLPNFKPSYSQDQTTSTHQTERERNSNILPKTEKSVMSTTQHFEKTMSKLGDTLKRKSSFSTTKSISPLENVPTLNKREPSQIMSYISKSPSHLENSSITLPGREGVDPVSRVEQTPSDIINKISYINIDQSIPVTFLNSKNKQSNNDINIPFEIYVDLNENPLLTEKVHSGSATKKYSRENIAKGEKNSPSVEISNFLYAKGKGKGSHERVESILNVEKSKRKENLVDDKSEIKVQSLSFSDKMNALPKKSTFEVELNQSIAISSHIPANEVSKTPLTRKTNVTDSKRNSLMTSTPITGTVREDNLANEDQLGGTKLNQSSNVNGLSKDLFGLTETNTEEIPNHLIDTHNKHPKENYHASKSILAFRGQTTKSQTPFENGYRSKKAPDKEEHNQVQEVMAHESVGAEGVNHKPTTETKSKIQNENAPKGLNDTTLTADQRDMDSNMPIEGEMSESRNDTPEVVYVGRIPNTTYNVFFATRGSITDSDTLDENETQEQNESVKGGPKGLLVFVNKKTKIDVSESDDTDEYSSEENIPLCGDVLDEPPTRKRKPSPTKHEPSTKPKCLRKRPGSGRVPFTEDEYGKRSKDKGSHELKSGIGDGTSGTIVRRQVRDKSPRESTSSKRPKDLNRCSTPTKRKYPSRDKRDGSKWITIYRSPSGLKKTQKYPCGCLRLLTFDPDTEEIVSAFCRDGSLCEVQKNKKVMQTPIRRKPSGRVSRLGSCNYILCPEIEIHAEVAVSKHRIQDTPPAPTFRGGDLTASLSIKSKRLNGTCNLYLDPRLVKYVLENNEKCGPRQLPSR